MSSVQRAREVEPLSASVNLYLGVAHTYAGQYDLALRQIHESIELDPGYYRSYMFLGRTLNGLDRYDEADRGLSEWHLSLAPDNLLSFAYLGVAWPARATDDALSNIAKMVKAAGDRT